jgi:serine/threonine-protein kinase HipA
MANKLKKTGIYVYADWDADKLPEQMGILTADRLGNDPIFAFEYERHWLNSSTNRYIDPNLRFFSGRQFAPPDKSNFGVFLDSSPDRWGRLLMRRREAAFARMENRKEKPLNEANYLLGVYDGHRMGGLRFKLDPGEDFLNNNKEMASPPWASLRDIEFASLQLEKENISEDPQYMKWLNLLVAPGSSLGGARPKASIVDTNGALWIAKFPSNNDERNMGAWEKLVQQLSIKAGIQMAEARAQRFNSRHHTFLNKRFDRTAGGHRIHFASAMTMLGYNDGANYRDGVSYLEIAEFLERFGANPGADLRQLWRRIVFFICISNTDDHLRNHGFLMTPKGWILSPAYDVNPEPLGKSLTLNISENDNSLSLDLAKSVAVFFRVNNKEANAIINEVQTGVNTWKIEASRLQIPNEEQTFMAQAFSNYQ